MSTHATDRSPGFGWSADELEFYGATAYSVVSAVRIALASTVADTGVVGTSEKLTAVLKHLENAEEALRQVMEEPENDLPRYEALTELEQLLQLRGAPDMADSLAGENGPTTGPLIDVLHAACYVTEWAVAGLREKLSDS